MPFLTAAWWAAKWFGVREAAGRYLNASAVTAIVITLGVLGLVIAGLWTAHSIRANAIEQTDAKWRAKIASDEVARVLRERAATRRAEQAADRERQNLFAQLSEAALAVSSLEEELSKQRAASGNPVIYPRALAKELNR